MDPMTVVIHLISGKKLQYNEPTNTGTTMQIVKDFYRDGLSKDNIAISFGRFIVPKSQIEYVEIFP